MTPLIDTHQHLIYPDRLDYPWTQAHEALKGKGFRLDDYKALTAQAGITGTIFMECDVPEAALRTETRMIASLAEGEGSGIVGIVAACRPETDEGFQDWLEETADLGVVGYRRILHNVDDDVSRSETFRANIRRIGKHGRVFDICCLARQLPLAIELARACEDTRLMLDHCGNPDIAAGEMDPWRENITALAGLPNVTAKISGILANCAPDATDLATLRPYLDHVISAFGPQRCAWGSDWPVVDTRSDLPSWISAFRALQADLSEDEAAEIGHRSAERIYVLKMPQGSEPATKAPPPEE